MPDKKDNVFSEGSELEKNKKNNKKNSAAKSGFGSMAAKVKTDGVSTMQDDLVDLISTKNHKKLFGKKTDKLAVNREIQRDLAEVYTDGDGKIPDLTKLEKTQRPIWKTVVYFLIGILIFVAVAAASGFIFFSNWTGDTFTNEKITLKIEPPLTLVSGQPAEYSVTITNKERVNLYNLQVEIFYPDNFQFASSSPAAVGDKSNTWNFSVLKSGESQKIELAGSLIAALDSVQTFHGILTFRPENFNADFKQEAIIDAKVASAIVTLTVSGPEKALANQAVEYVLQYHNLSDQELSDLQLAVDFPEGFVMTSSTPALPKESSNVWPLDKLPAQSGGQLLIAGNYGALSEGGNREFIGRLSLKHRDEYYIQSQGSSVAEIAKDQLSLQLLVNGSAEDQPIGFGDLLTYTVHFKNTGQEELNNVKIIGTLDSQILNWSSLTDQRHGIVSGNSLAWTGKEIAQLLKLSPGQEGDISWQIMVGDSSLVDDKNISRFSVKSQVAAEIQTATGAVSTVKSKTIINDISSDLGLSAAVRYYDADNIALGLGPIQPQVGEKSVYNIRLSLNNNLHDVSNLQVVVKLPKNVSWENKEAHNTGDLIYNSATNEVWWKISRLIKSANNTEASFNVGIKPTGDDSGRVLVLVSDVNLSAKDETTGSGISKQLKALTTSFNDPIVGQISGLVE